MEPVFFKGGECVRQLGCLKFSHIHLEKLLSELFSDGEIYGILLRKKEGNQKVLFFL